MWEQIGGVAIVSWENLVLGIWIGFALGVFVSTALAQLATHLRKKKRSR